MTVFSQQPNSEHAAPLTPLRQLFPSSSLLLLFTIIEPLNLFFSWTQNICIASGFITFLIQEFHFFFTQFPPPVNLSFQSHPLISFCHFFGYPSVIISDILRLTQYKADQIHGSHPLNLIVHGMRIRLIILGNYRWNFFRFPVTNFNDLYFATPGISRVLGEFSLGMDDFDFNFSNQGRRTYSAVLVLIYDFIHFF